MQNVVPLRPDRDSAIHSYQGQFLKTVPRRNSKGQITRFEFWFKPDKKLRTAEWDKRYKPSIRLPRDTTLRHGRDPKLDPTEHSAAWEDAAELFAIFNKLRSAPDDGGAWPHGTLRWLCNAWKESDWFRDDLSPNTQRLYSQQLSVIEDWADRTAAANNGIHPHVSQMTPKSLAAFLHGYDDRPTKRGHVRRVLKNLMAFGIEKGLRGDNPLDGLVMRRTQGKKVPMVLWNQAFVDTLAKWADENDRPEFKAMVMLMWDCGRRPADIFRLVAMNDMDRHQLETGQLNSNARPILYDAHRSAIMGWVAKTGNYIEIPLDEATIAAIAHVCPGPTDNRRHLFVHPDTGETYTTDTFKWIWRNARSYAADELESEVWKKALWRHGRASAIVRNKRAGLGDSLITSLSDHSDPETVYRHYWVPDDSQAAEAKRQRREAEGSA